MPSAAQPLEVWDTTTLLGAEDAEDAGSEIFSALHCDPPRRRRLGFAVGLVSVAALCACYSGLLGVPSNAARDATNLLLGATLVDSKKRVATFSHHIYKCAKKEEGVDFVFATLAGAGHVDNIASPDQCCALCNVEPECMAYTWVRDARLWYGNPGQCWLKGGDLVDKAHKDGVISAMVDRNASSNPPLRDFSSNTLSDEESAYAQEQRNELKQAREKQDEKEDDADEEEDGEEEEEEVAPEVRKAQKALEQKDKKLAEELSSQKAQEDLMTSMADELEESGRKEGELLEKAKTETLNGLKKKAAEKKTSTEAPTRPPTQPPTTTTQPPTTTLPATPAPTAAPTPAPPTDPPTLAPTPAPLKDPHVTEEEQAQRQCGWQNEGCVDSKCCKDPGYQCYTKNDFWAQCMPACYEGPNPVDQVSPAPWECKKLGKRADGELLVCSAEGDNCIKSKCCEKSGSTCWTKNATYALCKPSCVSGPDLKADDSQPWSCDKVGRRTPGAAPWLEESCSAVGQDCSKTACCADLGHQCYRQSAWYAECRKSCVPGDSVVLGGPSWTCEKLGWRSPITADDAEEERGMVGPWVEKTCVKNGDNCLDSQCCHAVGAQCYKKNQYWSACKLECSTAPDPHDNNESWACEPLGPKSWGLATKGYPSLYCITLYMPSGYEGDLLRHQLDINGGVFLCDGYDVFASEDDELGTTKDGILVKPVLIPKIEVGRSQDGTAGNAKLFMAVWDAIIALGRFANYDWTLKVDPDAVILPWRVREHMAPHVGEKVYVVNCNKFPDSPNFPMMYGSLEIFSGPAMLVYAEKSWSCGKELPWADWGEDYFMTKCMDYIGVGRIADFGVIGDDVCTGANCQDTYTGAFHPFKDVDSWHECWDAATSAEPQVVA